MIDEVFIVSENDVKNLNNLFIQYHFKLMSIGPNSVQPIYEYEEYSGSNGQRIKNVNFKSFIFNMSFKIEVESKYDWQLILSELKGLLYTGKPYYIISSREPGKRYRVLPLPWEVQSIVMKKGIISLDFEVFEGHSESVSTTLSNYDLESDWQFSQGLVAADYEYTFNKNKFVVYNAGDFTVDPREQELTIKIEGMSDGKCTIFNKTTGERFIYNKSIYSDRGEVLTLEGVYPKINGINCGIDTNHGLITLVPGENEIEIQNVSRIHASFDFRFLYK